MIIIIFISKYENDTSTLFYSIGFYKYQSYLILISDSDSVEGEVFSFSLEICITDGDIDDMEYEYSRNRYEVYESRYDVVVLILVKKV